MKRKIRLAVQLRLWNNGNLVLSTTRRIKQRVLATAQGIIWNKAYLKVTYDYNRGFFNSGEYFNFEDLKKALSDFTEKSLLDYIFGAKHEK